LICAKAQAVLFTTAFATSAQRYTNKDINNIVVVVLLLLLLLLTKPQSPNRAWWHMFVIPALGKLRQEDTELKANLGYKVSLREALATQ
jgi:hypothetical protein